MKALRCFPIEHLPNRQAVTDQFPLVEFPDDFFVARDLKDLRVGLAGVAVTNDEIAVFDFLQRGHPAQADVGAGDFVLDLPNDFFIGRNFDHAVAAAGGDQRVAVLQADRAEAAGVNEVLPNDLALAVVLGDNARVLGG